MSGPTREELAKRLGEVLATLAVLQPAEGSSTYLAQAERNLETCRLASDALLCADPLPSEGGERAELADRALRHATAIQVAHGPTARVLRECAAALLRQPLPPPAAGVSKAEVRRIISSHLDRLRATWDEHYQRVKRLPWTTTEVLVHQIGADIEALPEAAPREAGEKS